MNALAFDTFTRDLDLGEILGAAVVGALSAAAFSLGEAVACPSDGGLKDLPVDLLRGAFGGVLAESLTQLTASPVLSAIVTAFIAGILCVLVAPDPVLAGYPTLS